jgi:hypothetical protein
MTKRAFFGRACTSCLGTLSVFFTLLAAGCSGGGRASAGAGLTSADATSDAGAAALPCDLNKQDCVQGQKCVPAVVAGAVPGTGVCASDGTVAVGGACVLNTANMDAWEDNCVAGTLCDNDGPNNAYVCRKICSDDTACTNAGDKCADLFTTAWGFCLPSCTPFGNDCPAGNNCAVAFNDVSVTATNNTGFFVCKTPGPGTAFAPCTGLDTDCGPDLVCDGVRHWCTPICDSTHACPDAPPTDGGAGISCNPFTNLTNSQGVCN